MPKIRNIIIFIAILAVLAVLYFFLFKKENIPDLATTSANVLVADKDIANYQVIANTLPVLLSIRDIKLDDSIFADPAFQNLKDSSIILKPDGNEGRPNPFAPIGSDFYDISFSTETITEPISLPNSNINPIKTTPNNN